EVDASSQMRAAHASQRLRELRPEVILVVLDARLQVLPFQPRRRPGKRPPPPLDEALPVLHPVEVLVAPAQQQGDAQPRGAERPCHRCAARERVRVFERPGRDRQLHEQAMALEGSPYAAELRALGRTELREVDLATRATEGMDQLDERL